MSTKPVSWIRSVPPSSADARLSAIFDRVRGPEGVPSLWQACGLDPAGLEALAALERTLMQNPAPLTTAQASMIALVVSATNGSAYGVARHGPRLAKALGDEPLAHAVALDYREANLAARDRVLLDYAVALTCEPGERKREDIERVIEYGFDDAGVVKATELVALVNALDRVALALGVEREPGVTAWEFGAQK